MRKFEEVLKAIKEETSKRSSSEAVSKIATAYINDIDHEVKVVTTKNGEPVEETIKPVKDFRDMVTGVITKAGVDAADAEKFMSTYAFKAKEAATVAPFANGFVMANLQTGKAYELAKNNDVVATLRIKEIGEMTKTNRNPKTGEAITTKYAPHQRVAVKSTVPKSKKERV